MADIHSTLFKKTKMKVIAQIFFLLSWIIIDFKTLCFDFFSVVVTDWCPKNCEINWSMNWKDVRLLTFRREQEKDKEKKGSHQLKWFNCFNYYHHRHYKFTYQQVVANYLSLLNILSFFSGFHVWWWQHRDSLNYSIWLVVFFCCSNLNFITLSVLSIGN